jgi:hypothetical protein
MRADKLGVSAVIYVAAPRRRQSRLRQSALEISHAETRRKTITSPHRVREVARRAGEGAIHSLREIKPLKHHRAKKCLAWKCDVVVAVDEQHAPGRGSMVLNIEFADACIN